MMKKLSIIIFFLTSHWVAAQTNAQKIDLKDASQWKLHNKQVSAWKDTIILNRSDSDGLMIYQNFKMSNGSIEFDVKGQNLLQQSFVGVAFNVQNDSTYEHIYFRPFNFVNSDTIRRNRAVQYGALPASPWFKLREAYPGKYENKVNPVPDPNSWFHAKIVIEKPFIRVYVNHHSEPCLVVKSLAPNEEGVIGIWTGPSTLGSFTNLVVTPKK